MNAKRKLITTVASLGIFVILAGVALGVALAALTGTVNSGFTISYTANNIQVGIFGSYAVHPISYQTTANSEIEGDDSMFGWNGSIFLGNEPNNTKKDFKDIEFEISPYEHIEGVPNFAYMYFDIVNVDTKPLTVSLSPFQTHENLKIEFATMSYGEEIEKLNEFHEDVYDDLITIQTYLESKGVEFSENFHDYDEYRQNNGDGIAFDDIKLLINIISEYSNLIEQDQDILELVQSVVEKHEDLYEYSEDFPETFNVSPCGHTLEDIMTGKAGVQDLHKNLNNGVIFIKISIKNPAISIDNFSSAFNFNLNPAA